MGQHAAVAVSRWYGSSQHVRLVSMMKMGLEVPVMIGSRQLCVESTEIGWRWCGCSGTALFLLGRTLRHVNRASRGVTIWKQARLFMSSQLIYVSISNNNIGASLLFRISWLSRGLYQKFINYDNMDVVLVYRFTRYRRRYPALGHFLP